MSLPNSTVTTAAYTGYPVTGVYLSLGLSYGITLSSSENSGAGNNGVYAQSGGTWTIADASVATFSSSSGDASSEDTSGDEEGDSSGDVTITWNEDGSVTLTGADYVILEGVSAGSTTLTYTAPDGTSYSIPITIRDFWGYADSSSTSVKVYELYLTEVTDTTAYMAVLYGASNADVDCVDFLEVSEGLVVYVSFPYNAATAVDFFGTPDEGYALTLLGSTNSASHYMALDADTPGQTEFVSMLTAAGYNQVYYYGSAAVFDVVQAALDYDSDGGMGFTRQASSYGNVSSMITIRSRKLPTVDKEVTSVTRSDGSGTVDYTEETQIYVGDVIHYTVTITQYATDEAITYTQELLTDALYSGDVCVAGDGSVSSTLVMTDSDGSSETRYQVSEANSSSDTISATLADLNLSNDTLSANQTYTYTVSYTVTEEDVDQILTNTATFTYSYQSEYSSSGQSGAESATASISSKIEESPEDEDGTSEDSTGTDSTGTNSTSEDSAAAVTEISSGQSTGEEETEDSGSTGTDSVSMGDAGHAGLWVGLLIAAAAALAVVLWFGKRRRH